MSLAKKMGLQIHRYFITFAPMMEYFILVVTLLAAAADFLFWRSRHHGLKPWVRGVIYPLMGATILLPLLTLIESKLRSDNLPEQMIFSGLITLPIFVASMARLILYLGWLSRRCILRSVSIGVATLLLGTLGWGIFVGRTAIRVNEVTILSSRIPKGWDGARILQFSDLHLGALLDPEQECSRLVDTILALKPDLILFTGDLINIRHTELDSTASALLSRLQAPLGVYSITGNHDVGVYIKDSISLPREENTRLLIAKQKAMGWQVLSNESRTLLRRGDSITLTGIEFEPSLRNFRHARRLPETYRIDEAFASIPDSCYNITLAHLPQLWEAITDLGYGDLTLSGHVHSMQHKLPIGRRGWSLSRLLYRYWSGLYHNEEHYLYINDGIASVGIPARIGAPPEVTLFRLERQ